MQLLIGDISTAFLPHLPKIFFVNNCGPWHLSPGSCAHIFVKCDAGWPKPSRAQCHWWPTGRSMACSSWEIQEGAFNRYLLLKKGKVTKMGLMWFAFCLCDSVGWQNSTWPLCEAWISRLKWQCSSREEILHDHLPETWECWTVFYSWTWKHGHGRQA